MLRLTLRHCVDVSTIRWPRERARSNFIGAWRSRTFTVLSFSVEAWGHFGPGEEMDQVIVGVDAHKSNHIAVAINSHGARLVSMTVATTQDGYRRLEAWATGLGQVTAFCVEGTGSYGAGLSRDLRAKRHTVLG